MSGPRFDDLSDEDFLNQVPGQEAAALDAQEPDTTAIETPAPVTLEAETDVTAPAGDEGEVGGEDEVDPVADEDLDNPEAGTEGDGDKGDAPAGQDDPDQGEDHTTPKHTDKAEAPADGKPDYEALYKQVMSTFRANGKDFTPSSPEEATRLMQMGANYAKKMEGLKPHLKLLRMLENHQLLDEGKLSFLIDLDKKDPKAIQKLLHDGKVDPLDLDPSAEPTYQPSSRAPSDEEMALRDAIEAVQATPTGRDTIALVNKEFDPASKKVIADTPNLLTVLDQQRSNGIYAKITEELERRKLFGEFQNVPFIHAYKAVGDALHAQGKLLPAGGSAGHPTPAPQEVQSQALDTRSARARKPAASREQVRAITAAPGSSAKSARVPLNPLAMSDAEIMSIPTTF